MTRPALRVLYIDDDRINTLLFVEICRPAAELEVLTAAHADEAIELAREHRPDLLVVDLHMPDTDGFALLPRLRALDGLSATPAILCTAERLEEVHAAAAAAGFAGVWTKPVQLSTVREGLAGLALTDSA